MDVCRNTPSVWKCRETPEIEDECDIHKQTKSPLAVPKELAA